MIYLCTSAYTYTYMQQIWSKKFNIIYNPSVMFMVNAIITHFVSYTSEINRK